MTDFDAVMIAEGVTEITDSSELIDAWQHLINTGLVWRLQGYFGRTAARLIEEGVCTAAVGTKLK